MLLTPAIALQAQPGALDVSFGGGGAVVTAIGADDDDGHAVLITPTGKIICTGATLNEDEFGIGDSDMFLLQYTAGGALDPAFNGTGKVVSGVVERDEIPMAMALLSDGRILVAGHSTVNATENADFLLRCYQSNGTVDTDFGSGGEVLTDLVFQGTLGAAGSLEWASDIVVLSNGDIVLAGSASNTINAAFAMARYTTAGQLVTTFGEAGKVNTVIGGEFSEALAMARTPDDHLVLAGYMFDATNEVYNFALAKYTSSGVLDASFGDDGIVITAVPGSFQAYITAMELDAEGRIVVAGMVDGAATVARYTADGILDPSFSSDGIFVSNIVPNGQLDPSITLQPDGKILLIHTTDELETGVLRLAENGTVDNSFSGDGHTAFAIGPDGASTGSAAALQSDEKIVVVGTAIVDFTNDVGVLRLLNEFTVGLDDLQTNYTAPLVYPMPIVNSARFTYTLPASATVDLVLTDMQGRLVRTFLSGAERPAGENGIDLDLSGCTAGSYLLVFTTGTKHTTVQVTKD